MPARPWFAPEILRVDLNLFAPNIDTTLFALNWKFGGKAGREKRGESAEQLRALLDEWVRKAHEHGWVQPQAIVGVWPCQSDGDEVVVYDPQLIDQRDRSLRVYRCCWCTAAAACQSNG